MTFLSIDDIRLSTESSVKRFKRFQRATFGDGYSQILSDGLNADKEIWTCRTLPLQEVEAYSIESYFRQYADQAIQWSPPDATKTFQSKFSSGVLNLGYTNISSLSLSGYSRPVDYTANLVSGILTSVTIANNVAVSITLTEAPKQYVLRDGWEITYIASNVYQITFELERFYG